MKKILALILASLLLIASACAFAEETQLSGGWTPSESPEITEELQAIFDKGLEGLVGVDYKLVAFLGSQVVAGTNYCFLVQGTVVYPGATPTYALVYLYEDLSGNVEIMNIATLDIGAFCTYGAE